MYKKKTLICSVVLFIMALLPFVVSAQTTITTSVVLNQIVLDGYTWPITISGGSSTNPVVVTLGEDITFSSLSKYFIIGSDYVTFDGNNHTITITGSINNYLGLIKNGEYSPPAPTVNGYSYITIKNLGVSSTDCMLNTYAGWIGQDYFGYNATNITIDNCHSSSGSQSYGYGGGIVGRKSPVKVTNCYSTGPIYNNGGGIAGSQFSGTVINCYSTGTIGSGAGGIMGNNSSGIAINCYSTGVIALNGGGIIGSNSSGNAINCHSSGDISGTTTLGGGGIMGASASGTATYCYSTGFIGQSAGGIMGSNTKDTARAINCYSTGQIDRNGGGIIGGGTATNKPAGNVTNCYSTGAVGQRGGGIAGRFSSGNITNCYTIGSLDLEAGGINGYSSTAQIYTCLSKPGSWSDSDASSVLTGTDGTAWIGYRYGEIEPFTLAPYTTNSIITTANFGSFTTYSGLPSNAQTIVISGKLLQSDITVSVPVGFELSTSSSGIFSSSISLSPIAGNLNASTLYIRLTNNVVNGASGTITIASSGYTTKNIATGLAVLQSASTNRYGSKTIDSATRINNNGTIGLSGVSINGKITLYTPSLSATSLISSINANTAVSGGTILSNGGSIITASGVCWSLSPNPTTADNKTSDGTALSFTSNLTGLIAGTVYYVRAYATNSEGTSYGTGVSFTAL